MSVERLYIHFNTAKIGGRRATSRGLAPVRALFRGGVCTICGKFISISLGNIFYGKFKVSVVNFKFKIIY